MLAITNATAEADGNAFCFAGIKDPFTAALVTNMRTHVRYRGGVWPELSKRTFS